MTISTSGFPFLLPNNKESHISKKYPKRRKGESTRISCCRKDTAALIGCRISDVALYSCSRRCCHYPDDEISENTKNHLLNNTSTSLKSTSVNQASNAQPPGRKELYYSHCASHLRSGVSPKKRNEMAILVVMVVGRERLAG
jgi:hypothetical protein